MKTTHDYIRERLLQPIEATSDYETGMCKVIHFMEEPSVKAAQRLILGNLRYGSLDKDREQKYDYVAFIQRRLNKYRETGNKDWLLDVRNGCDLEYFFESHPNAHYDPADEHDIHQEQV